MEYQRQNSSRPSVLSAKPVCAILNSTRSLPNDTSRASVGCDASQHDLGRCERARENFRGASACNRSVWWPVWHIITAVPLITTQLGASPQPLTTAKEWRVLAGTPAREHFFSCCLIGSYLCHDRLPLSECCRHSVGIPCKLQLCIVHRARSQ